MFLIVYLIFCLVIAAIATSRGRTGIGWFFIAILISPLISIIIFLVLPEAGVPAAHRVTQNSDPQKRCLYCKELINAEAIKCRFCGSDLTSDENGISVTPPSGGPRISPPRHGD